MDGHEIVAWELHDTVNLSILPIDAEDFLS